MTSNQGDPAVEAARRAYPNTHVPQIQGVAKNGAREALAPIRDLHQSRTLHRNVYNADGTWIGQAVHSIVCDACYQSASGGPSHCSDYCDDDCEGVWPSTGSAKWPCATARLAYAADELEQP